MERSLLSVSNIFGLFESRLIIAKSDIDKKASQLVLLSLVERKSKKYFLSFQRKVKSC